MQLFDTQTVLYKNKYKSRRSKNMSIIITPPGGGITLPQKIALESEAKSIGGSSASASSTKCCTKTRAEELGCEVSGDYDSNQLVPKSRLTKKVINYEIKVPGTYFLMLVRSDTPPAAPSPGSGIAVFPETITVTCVQSGNWSTEEIPNNTNGWRDIKVSGIFSDGYYQTGRFPYMDAVKLCATIDKQVTVTVKSAFGTHINKGTFSIIKEGNEAFVNVGDW